MHTGPVGARCCDNCDPKAFPVETIDFYDPEKLKAGRRARSDPELTRLATGWLKSLRETIVKRDWGVQSFITGRDIIDDKTVALLASSAAFINSEEDLKSRFRWRWGEKYSPEIVGTLRELRAGLEEEPEDSGTGGEGLDIEPPTKRRRLDSASKATRSLLKAVFDGCMTAVAEAKDEEGRSLCNAFKSLPRTDVS